MGFESKRQTWWLHIDGKGRIVSTAATRGALRVLKPREKEGERVIEVAEVKATEHQSVTLHPPVVRPTPPIDDEYHLTTEQGRAVSKALASSVEPVHDDECIQCARDEIEDLRAELAKALECRSVALTVPDVERIVAWASLWRGCHDPHWSRDDDELFGRLQDIVYGLTEQESVDQGGEW